MPFRLLTHLRMYILYPKFYLFVLLRCAFYFVLNWHFFSRIAPWVCCLHYFPYWEAHLASFKESYQCQNRMGKSPKLFANSFVEFIMKSCNYFVKELHNMIYSYEFFFWLSWIFVSFSFSKVFCALIWLKYMVLIIAILKYYTRLILLFTFLAILSILSRTCIPWFLKLMMSLSSQVILIFGGEIIWYFLCSINLISSDASISVVGNFWLACH